MNKWSGQFWANLGERVGSVVVYGLITLLTTVNVTDLDWHQSWLIVLLPAVLSLLKGLLANLADSESGPSLLPAPPKGEGAVIEEAVDPEVDEPEDEWEPEGDENDHLPVEDPADVTDVYGPDPKAPVRDHVND